MRYGMPYCSGFGDPAKQFEYVAPNRQEAIARNYRSIPVLVKPWTSTSPSQVHLYLNTKKAAQYYDEGSAEKEIVLPIPYGARSISIEAIRTGQLTTPLYECEHAMRLNEHAENKKITLHWTYTPEIIEDEESGGDFVSNWVLTGLVQGRNCEYIQGAPARGRLTFTITIDTGIATIELLAYNAVVASGSGPVGTTVTLTEQNDSGLCVSGGAVDVDALAVDVTDGVLDVRWPKYMRVKRDTASPPTTVVATIPFVGENNPRWPEPSDLAAATYYYRIQPLSDTGEDGTASAIKSFTIAAAPEAPTNLARSSGHAAALVLSFNRSTTAGATYRLYGPLAIGSVPNMDVPLNTAASGTPGGATTIAVGSAITGYPGIIHFLLRAVAGGIEERNGAWLAVEFDGSGNFIQPRPNEAGIDAGTLVISSGRTVTLKGVYDPTREKLTATHLYLYARAKSGSYPGTPDNVVALAAASNGLKKGALSVTLPANGYYFIKVVAASAALSGVESYNPQETEIHVTDSTMAAATNFDGELSRG